MTHHTNGLMGRITRTVIIAAAVALAIAGAASLAAAQPAPPVNTVEIGPGAVTDGSFKAGEYNGLFSKGAFLDANIDVRSGAAWNSDSALRWRIRGTDLGLDTRSLSATVGEQGKYRLLFNFDQLRRNRSDTYETPFDGAGTSTLTLPAAWVVPTVVGSGAANARGLSPSVGTLPYISGGVLVQPSAAQTSVVARNASIDQPLFNPFDVYTRRTRFDGGFNYNLTPSWSVDADFRPEHKSGTKLMGTVSRNTGGDISTPIPDLIDYTHDQFTTNVNYKTDRRFVQAGYYGSFFRNGVTAMTWQNWASGPGPAATVNTITSPPGNDFNQVNATAGVTLSPASKLTGNASYSRGTQNDPFVLLGQATPLVPVSSLNGVVATTSAYVRWTDRPAKKLNVVATYKFDDRKNETPVHIFQFADAEEPNAPNTSFASSNPLGALLAPNANANRPYSRRQNLFTGDADLAVARGQWVKAGYDFERFDRWCPGSWIDCADAPHTNENTVRAEWRTRASESIQVRVNYAFGFRRGDYNENAWLAVVPYANVVPLGSSLSAYQAMLQNGLTGYGPAAGYAGQTPNALFFPLNNVIPPALYANGGNRISELIGMRRFYVADRNRNRARAQLSWQASERLAFSASGDLTRDDYPDSTYGLQSYKTYAADADATFAVTDTFSITFFYTYENLRQATAGNTYTANSTATNVSGATALAGNSCDGYATLQQRNLNNKVDPCLNWGTTMADRADTFGAGLRRPFGPVDVTANLVFTRQRWDNTPAGGNWANNPLLPAGSPANAIAAFFIPATATPTVTADTTELRIDGRYPVAHGALRVGYAYLHMSNADWMYEGMQFGTANSVLPTLEQPFNYGVNVFSASYVLTF